MHQTAKKQQAPKPSCLWKNSKRYGRSPKTYWFRELGRSKISTIPSLSSGLNETGLGDFWVSCRQPKVLAQPFPTPVPDRAAQLLHVVVVKRREGHHAVPRGGKAALINRKPCWSKDPWENHWWTKCHLRSKHRPS